MIIRAEHKAKVAPYLIVSQKVIFDNRLPYGPKCLLLAMLSYPDTWNFTETYLAEILQEDVQTIINWLGVLIKLGYLHTNVKVPYGDSYLTVSWLITETPKGVRYD